MKRFLKALAWAALAALAVFIVPVSAHALVVRSVPDVNAVLDQPPSKVELFFSEAVEASFSSIQVLDSHGAVVDAGDSHVDPADATHVTVSLRPLPDGVYTVSWRALSGADGHVTIGAFPFTVGQAGPGAPAVASVSPGTPVVPGASPQGTLLPPVSNLIAKWLVYLAAAALAGGPLFVIAVWKPVNRSLPPETNAGSAPQPVWSRLAALALCLFIASMTLACLAQAGQASGVEEVAPWAPAAGQWLFTTRPGALWLAQLMLGVALAGLLPAAGARGRRPQRPMPEWISLGVAAGLLLIFSLSSHAAADADPLLPVAADWLHLMAASVWVGGLIYFAVGLWTLHAAPLATADRTEFTARLIPRFSTLAVVSVGVLTLTGLYSAYLRIGTLEALVNSTYGWALILKLGLALPMVVMGAINLLVVTPRMQRTVGGRDGNFSLAGSFRAMVTSEAILGLILLGAVSLLTLLPPAQAAAPALTHSARADDVQIQLTITPGHLGDNTFQVHLSVNGQPLSGAKAVELRFTPERADIPPISAGLNDLGNGEYAAQGAFLSLPDTWQVQVVVRREGKFDAFAGFSYPIGVTTAGQVVSWSQVSGLLIMGLALAYLFAINHLSHSRRQLVGAGVLPALALAVAALALL